MNPDAATIRIMESRGLTAWPAREVVPHEGWLLRSSGGRSRRANAAHPDRPSGTLPGVREAAERFYRERGQPSVFRLTPLAPPAMDATLADAGYRHTDASLVLTRPLPVASGTKDPAVSVAGRPDPTWLAGSAAASGLDGPEAAARDAIVARIGARAGFATVRGDHAGEPSLGYGFAVVDRGWAGLFAIVTTPAARRRGAGTRLVKALLAWGEAEGAQAAYLQVGAANAPALALYARLGFGTGYPYHYRQQDPAAGIPTSPGR